MMLMDKAQKGTKKQVGGICSSGATSCIGVLRCVRDALMIIHTFVFCNTAALIGAIDKFPARVQILREIFEEEWYAWARSQCTVRDLLTAAIPCPVQPRPGSAERAARQAALGMHGGAVSVR